MVRPSKGITTSLNLRTKIPNNKQNTGFSITVITNQDFRNILRRFKNSPHVGCNSKHVHNKPAEAYLFPTKHITKLVKGERNDRTNYVKLGVNKTIGHVNKAIQYE